MPLRRASSSGRERAQADRRSGPGDGPPGARPRRRAARDAARRADSRHPPACPRDAGRHGGRAAGSRREGRADRRRHRRAPDPQPFRPRAARPADPRLRQGPLRRRARRGGRRLFARGGARGCGARRGRVRGAAGRLRRRCGPRPGRAAPPRGAAGGRPDLPRHRPEPRRRRQRLQPLQAPQGRRRPGFDAAAHVFEDTFTTPAVQHVPLETHACVASVGPGPEVTLWDTTQIPYAVAAQIAELLGIDASRVRVVVPTLGGGYGAKCYPKIEPVTAALALAARAAGPPPPHPRGGVRHHHQARVRDPLTTGLDADGRSSPGQRRCHFNTGAYADIGPRLIKNGGYGTGGPYAIPNVWVDSYAVYTNLPPAGAFRGYGQPGGVGLRDPDGHDRRAALASIRSSCGCATCSRRRRLSRPASGSTTATSGSCSSLGGGDRLGRRSGACSRERHKVRAKGFAASSRARSRRRPRPRRSS